MRAAEARISLRSERWAQATKAIEECLRIRAHDPSLMLMRGGGGEGEGACPYVCADAA